MTQPAPAEAPRAGNWFTRGGWWFLVHLLSLGLLLPVPLAHAAVRTRRPGYVVLALASVVLVVTTFVLVRVSDHAPDGSYVGLASTLSSVTMLTGLLGGLVVLMLVRPRVFDRPAPRPAGWDRPPPDPAIAAALAARERRAEARRLAAEDPLLARELRIGRPDLQRTYDDGGLVDLNTAPGSVIARTLGIAPVHAEQIVACRTAAGRFTAVEDVFAWADLPVDVWDLVRDRGVVLGR
ncbi:helix-hairpin-helix domain-containing protein [Actinomycetospora aeridis]|uniref:Helix-hairpin-helix domain-containing protein n=1 Tax=Actinomycetospora aeridis TaxID=3129231 RepID=A0ABU8NFU7_9PSEU